jgi:hypothetical protein
MTDNPFRSVARSDLTATNRGRTSVGAAQFARSARPCKTETLTVSGVDHQEEFASVVEEFARVKC